MRTLLILLLFLFAPAAAQELKVTVEKFDVPKQAPIARSARIWGEVVLFLRLNLDGSVAAVRVGKGHPMLVPLSVESAKKWKFHCWECAFPEGFEHKLTFSFIEGKCSGEGERHTYRFPESVSIATCSPIVEFVATSH